MKTFTKHMIAWHLTLGLAGGAFAQTAPAPAPADDAAKPAENAADAKPAPDAAAPPATPATPAPDAPADAAAAAAATPAPAPVQALPPLPKPEIRADGLLRMNFRGAPLDLVLNYLSEAAGFTIVLETPVRGTVDMWSAQLLTKEDAVDLLNTVLNRRGLTAIRNGKTLTIVSRDDAKTRDIPVKTGSDPAGIPKNDELITQIIPIRTIEAVQLSKDLQPLISPSATLVANESGNAIVVTDTQANIHRLTEIIKAIDNGADAVTEVRVFQLKNADPTETADLLSSLFPDESKASNSNTPNSPFLRFGGGFGGFGGFGRGGGGGAEGGGRRSANNANNAQQQRAQKRDRVIAVADPRTTSVVVSCAKELMEQIEQIVEKLDSNPAKQQRVYVFTLENADAQNVAEILHDMFERNSTSSSSSLNQNNNALTTRSSTTVTTGAASSTTSTTGIGSGGGR